MVLQRRGGWMSGRDENDTNFTNGIPEHHEMNLFPALAKHLSVNSSDTV
jgi:hypothetical protein